MSLWCLRVLVRVLLACLARAVIMSVFCVVPASVPRQNRSPIAPGAMLPPYAGKPAEPRAPRRDLAQP